MPLLVHGVVRAGHQPPPRPRETGSDAPDVRLVTSGPVAAAVAEIDEQAQLDENDAARHLDTLILLMRNGPVLPLTFGTVAPDDDGVRGEVLDPVSADLADRLDAVDGLGEARLDILFDETPALRELMRADPQLRDLAARARGTDRDLDSRITLGETVSQGLTQWRRQQADGFLPSLTAAVEDTVELESSDPLQQRWAFLVRLDRIGELDQVVGRIRGSVDETAQIEYVGPLPVYSFLQSIQPETGRTRSAWGW